MLITDLTNLIIAIDARAGIDIHAADTHLLFALAVPLTMSNVRHQAGQSIADRRRACPSRHDLLRDTRMTKIKALPWLAAALTLGGCVVPPPQAPSVLAMPGEGKAYPQFQQDDAYCRQTAAQSAGGGPAAQAATDRAVGSAVVGTALGAAAGALIGAGAGNAGAGAAIGAGTGLLAGSSYGAGGARYSARYMQRQYDMTYTQCMVGQGNQVQSYGMQPSPYPPPYAAPYPPYPPPYGY